MEWAQLHDAAQSLERELSRTKASSRTTYIGSTKSFVDKLSSLISVILTRLQADGFSPQDDTDDVVTALARTLAKTMSPVVLPLETYEAHEDDDMDLDEDRENDTRARVVQRCRATAPAACRALNLLAEKSGSESIADDSVLVILCAYANPTEEWVDTEETASQATALLMKLLTRKNLDKNQLIIEVILQRYLRPLFSKSKPASITASGRKAEYLDPAGGRTETLPDDSSETKPWKFTDFRAIPVITWAAHEADVFPPAPTPFIIGSSLTQLTHQEDLVNKHWPLFLPVVLTLADDQATSVRQRGLVIIKTFITKLPTKILHGAGLSKIFEDTIFPTLNYLPSLTPENESIQLLIPAYEALCTLADKQPPAAAAARVHQLKNKLLDQILREGVFSGYFHAKQHVRIVEVLCQQTVIVLDRMGIHSVKHLKDLVPMISAIMTDPFAHVAPSTLLAAVKSLQAVLINCWPRIASSPWQDEMLQSLVLCWLNLAEETNTELDVVRQELQASAKMLAAILKTEDARLSELSGPLIAQEPSLSKLLTGWR
ncbi:hypothetical protein OQA88_2777 [Cercophora sp. LCS_1]